MRKRGFLGAFLAVMLLALVVGQACATTPCAEWKLNDGSGASARDSIDSYNGTLHGNVTWQNDSPAAAGLSPSKCVKFGGNSGDFIDLGTSPALSPASMTVAFWVKGPAVAGQVLLGKYDSYPGAYEFILDGNGVLALRLMGTSSQIYVGDNATAVKQVSAAQINDGNWHHIAGTYDAATGKASIYFDGQLLEKANWSGPINTNSQSLHLGQRGYPGAESSFTGYMSDVRIYNSALTQAEIVGLAGTGASMQPITGKVSDAATPADGIPNVTLTLNTGDTTTTDSNGDYTIMVFPGTYTLTAMDNDHYVRKMTVTVTPGTPAVNNFILVAIPTPATPVTDTFTRDNSSSLGTTEDSLHIPWIVGASAATIDNNSLLFTGTGAGYGASLNNTYAPADLDATVNASVESFPVGDWFFVTYRQNYPGDIWNGYVAMFDVNGGWVNLCDWVSANPTNGQTWTISPKIDWTIPHAIRIRAVGPHHQVWVDDRKVVDTISWGRQNGGYFGLGRWSAQTRFDNLSIGQIVPPTGTVAGRVYNIETSAGVPNATVKASSGQSTTTDANGNYSLSCNANATVNLSVSQVDYYSASVSGVIAVPGQTATVNIALSPLPTPSSADVVYDDFERGPTTSIGNTEDPNHYPWVLTQTGEDVSINSDNMLVIGANPDHYGIAVGDGFQPADFEVECDMSMGYSGSWGGIAYRSSTPGIFSPDGYVLYCPYDGTSINLFTSLPAGNGEGVFATYTPPVVIDWSVFHHIRIRVVGSRHTVWLDNGDTPIIDVYDYQKLTGGYISLTKYNTPTTFDNFKATRYTSDTGQISGMVSESGNPLHRVAGATVNLSGYVTTTDINGRYAFTRLSAGTYTLSVVADGYYARALNNVVLPSSNSSIVQDMALAPLGTPSSVVTDDFNRPNSSNLGTTTDPLHLPWITNDTQGLQISGNQLYMPLWGTGGASLDSSFKPADIDATMDITITQATGWDPSYVGFAYRNGAASTWDNTGYMVRCKDDGAGVQLIRGSVIATGALPAGFSWTATNPAHQLRVTAIGAHHQVYVDGAKVIDAIDTGKTTGGFVTLYRDTTDGYIDNFNLSAYTTPNTTVTGTVYQTGNPSATIAGANVVFSDGTVATTNSSGVYTAAVPFPGGRFYINTAVADGFSNAGSIEINPIAGGTVTQDIALSPSGPGVAVFDTFSRPNSSSFGATEDPNHFAWGYIGDPGASIQDQALNFTQGPASFVVSLPGSFVPRDIDLTVDATVVAKSDGDWFAIPYRQDNGGEIWNGYVAMFDSFGTWAGIYYFNQGVGSGTGGVTLSTPIDWSKPHKIRIVAIGAHHQLYIDGVLVQDKIDGQKVIGGYVGLTRWASGVVYDNFTLTGGGKIAPQAVAGINAAKAAANGTAVSFGGQIVTAVFDKSFYIEEFDRTSGIMVSSPATVNVGDMVTALVGRTGQANGEKYIVATSVSTATTTDKVTPLGMSNRSLGGSSNSVQPGITDATGMNNIGLLVKVYGKVYTPGLNDFYLGDGSGVSVHVLVPAGKDIPLSGAYVAVTGISSCEQAGSSTSRLVKAISIDVMSASRFMENLIGFSQSGGYNYIWVAGSAFQNRSKDGGAPNFVPDPKAMAGALSGSAYYFYSSSVAPAVWPPSLNWWAEYAIPASQAPFSLDNNGAGKTWYLWIRTAQSASSTAESDYVMVNGDSANDLNMADPVDADWWNVFNTSSTGANGHTILNHISDTPSYWTFSPYTFTWWGSQSNSTRQARNFRVYGGNVTFRLYEREAAPTNALVDVICWTDNPSFVPPTDDMVAL